MKIFRNNILFILTSILAIPSTIAQGCSDAGFCTLNSLKPDNHSTLLNNKNQVSAGLNFGGADHSISILGSYIEYNRQISKKIGVDAKITSISQSGDGISNFGISDLYLNGDYRANELVKFNIGVKVPLNDANKKKGNLSLPMDYQSSLGTFDLILGIGFKVNKIQFVLASQQPLTQNKNEFLVENFPINSNIREFQSTNNFKRSGDVLLRVSYPILLTEKIKLTPSLLPIYHLSHDQYTNRLGIESKINGSQGLTLNGNVYVDYEINNKNSLQFSIGVPFIVRNVRPDGLTRSFIVNFEYQIRF